MTLFEKVKGWLIVAGLFIIGLVAVFFKGKREGREEKTAEQQAEAFHEHVEAENKIHEAKQKVDSMPDDVVDDELSGWVRNKERK